MRFLSKILGALVVKCRNGGVIFLLNEENLRVLVVVGIRVEG